MDIIQCEYDGEFGKTGYTIEVKDAQDYLEAMDEIRVKHEDIGGAIDGLDVFIEERRTINATEQQILLAHKECAYLCLLYKDVESSSSEHKSRKDTLNWGLDHCYEAKKINLEFYNEDVLWIKNRISNELDEINEREYIQWCAEQKEKERLDEIEFEEKMNSLHRDRPQKNKKSVFDRLIEHFSYDPDKYQQNNDIRWSERNNNEECEPRTGWEQVYPEYVGGPIKIDSQTWNDCYLRLYKPGQVYPGADHLEGIPYGLLAIHAYWSGGRLYAQLSNGRICEWGNPGCPIIK